MTARRAAKPLTQQPIQRPIIKHYTVNKRPVARCKTCLWSQASATLAECRIHVRHNPTHLVYRDTIVSTMVVAETPDGKFWGEENDG